MSTKILEKLVNDLSKEVIQLRSFVISIAGKDPEGDYRPEYVNKIKKISNAKSKHEYNGPGSLLKLIKNK